MALEAYLLSAAGQRTMTHGSCADATAAVLARARELAGNRIDTPLLFHSNGLFMLPRTDKTVAQPTQRTLGQRLGIWGQGLGIS